MNVVETTSQSSSSTKKSTATPVASSLSYAMMASKSKQAAAQGAPQPEEIVQEKKREQTNGSRFNPVADDMPNGIDVERIHPKEQSTPIAKRPIPDKPGPVFLERKDNGPYNRRYHGFGGRDNRQNNRFGGPRHHNNHHYNNHHQKDYPHHDKYHDRYHHNKPNNHHSHHYQPQENVHHPSYNPNRNKNSYPVMRRGSKDGASEAINTSPPPVPPHQPILQAAQVVTTQPPQTVPVVYMMPAPGQYPGAQYAQQVVSAAPAWQMAPAPQWSQPTHHTLYQHPSQPMMYTAQAPPNGMVQYFDPNTGQITMGPPPQMVQMNPQYGNGTAATHEGAPDPPPKSTYQKRDSVGSFNYTYNPLKNQRQHNHHHQNEGHREGHGGGERRPRNEDAKQEISVRRNSGGKEQNGRGNEEKSNAGNSVQAQNNNKEKANKEKRTSPTQQKLGSKEKDETVQALPKKTKSQQSSTGCSDSANGTSPSTKNESRTNSSGSDISLGCSASQNGSGNVRHSRSCSHDSGVSHKTPPEKQNSNRGSCDKDGERTVSCNSDGTPRRKFSNNGEFKKPDAELAAKIIDLIEYYLSDEYLAKDKYLLRQIRCKSEGYISIKLMTSFKKVKKITRDWRVVRYALLRTKNLEISPEGFRVKRAVALPEALRRPRLLSSVVSIRLPEEYQSVDAITQLFSKYGEIGLVRLLKPGKEIPSDLRNYATQVPDIGKSLCAVVDFEQSDAALQAVRCLKEKLLESGMRVALLGPRVRRTLYKQDRADGDTTSSVTSTSEVCELHGACSTTSHSEFGSMSMTTGSSANQSGLSSPHTNTSRTGSKCSSEECQEEECCGHKQSDSELSEKSSNAHHRTVEEACCFGNVRKLAAAAFAVKLQDANCQRIHSKDSVQGKLQQYQKDDVGIDSAGITATTTITEKMHTTGKIFLAAGLLSPELEERLRYSTMSAETITGECNDEKECDEKSVASSSCISTASVATSTTTSEVIKIKSKVSIILREPRCPPTCTTDSGFNRKQE